ncbi:GDNF family receptor alpha-like isoform X1 [Amblyraja radiata]|uniref:GDNF family receptor alpha-like isoform X1 n=1 Tax=Amblyraja radiata TaxID=386614 RepID=UPI001402AE03|nr:GDNF family receptor alpha-like isoform X1 [Amblyraja radiata]
MGSVLLLAAILISQITNGPGLETTKCLQVTKWCIADTGGCKDVWNLIEDVCNQTGDACTVKDHSSCNITIQHLANSYPAFRECSCLEDKSCDFFRQLGRQCSSQEERSRAPTLSSGVPPEWKRRLRIMNTNKSTRKGNDCPSAKHSCLRSPNCSSVYARFKKMCRHKKDNCSIPAIGQKCLTAWQALQRTKLAGCSCSRQGRLKCLRIRTSLASNACVQIASRRLNTSSDEENEVNIPGASEFMRGRKSAAEFTALAAFNSEKQNHSMSCLKVTEQCIKDQDVCNRHLTPQKKACPQARKQCNLEDCHRAIRSFYTKISPDLAQMLVFCGCNPSDDLCLQAKETLHNNTCANYMDTVPTCLHLREKCLAEDVCRSRYELFQVKCWGHLMGMCSQEYDPSCLSGLSWNEWTCKADAECMAAYISTRGTLLQVQCTCNGITRDDQPFCELFQHMLNHQVCFTQVSSPAVEAEASQMEEELSVTRTQMKLSGITICAITYVCVVTLVLGVVITVILCKTRISKISEQTAKSSTC